jgi:uncharacterized membrane protein
LLALRRLVALAASATGGSCEAALFAEGHLGVAGAALALAFALALLGRVVLIILVVFIILPKQGSKRNK